MMDVNSMAERGGNEVWFHRHMKSMVAMEFGYKDMRSQWWRWSQIVVEGGLKLVL